MSHPGTLPTFPFGGSLEEQHRSLHAMMSWIEAELDRQQNLGLEHDGPILGPLRAFAESLERHFTYEEENGFLEAWKHGASEEIQRLTGQHRDLLHRVGDIVRGYELAAHPEEVLDPSLVDELRAVMDALRAHDRDEHEVLRRTSGDPA